MMIMITNRITSWMNQKFIALITYFIWKKYNYWDALANPSTRSIKP
jgi:hypothetical protein